MKQKLDSKNGNFIARFYFAQSQPTRKLLQERFLSPSKRSEGNSAASYLRRPDIAQLILSRKTQHFSAKELPRQQARLRSFNLINTRLLFPRLERAIFTGVYFLFSRREYAILNQRLHTTNCIPGNCIRRVSMSVVTINLRPFVPSERCARKKRVAVYR